MITGIQYYTAQGKRPSFQGLFYFFTAGCRRHDSLLHSITPIFTRPQAKNEHVFENQQSVGNSCGKATRDDLYHSTGIGLDTLETTQTLHHGRGTWNGSRKPPQPFAPPGYAPAPSCRLRRMRPSSPPPSFVLPAPLFAWPGVPSPCSVLCLCWACRVRVGCVGASARVFGALTLRPGGKR